MEFNKKIDYMSWDDVNNGVNILASQLKECGRSWNGIYAIPRGGLILGVMLSHKLGISMLKVPTYGGILVVDDILETGSQLRPFYQKTGNSINTIVTLCRTKDSSELKPDYHIYNIEKGHFIYFPWEV